MQVEFNERDVELNEEEGRKVEKKWTEGWKELKNVF